MSDDVKAPAFKSQPDDNNEGWRTFLYNQERIIQQMSEFVAAQRRLIDAMEQVASPERTRKVEEGMERMVEAVNLLTEKMELANGQLGMAVTKLASAFWSLMKIPVAVIVVGVASWAFLYEQKIGEHTWLIMLGVAVFPWLGDSISAIGKIFRGNGGNQK